MGNWIWMLLVFDLRQVMALFQRNVVESRNSQSWEGMLVGKKKKCLKRWGSDLDEMAGRGGRTKRANGGREWKQLFTVQHREE